VETVRLSTKGQLILPKAIRDRHRWGAGTELVIIDRGSELIVKPARAFPPTELEPPDAAPVYRGKPLSLDEMDRAVAAEAGKHR
jgi:AbrB family looped-hinge helix DNA binding protein